MKIKYVCFLLILGEMALENYAARILVYFSTAAISHQVVSRDFTQELVKRGHEVVVITSDPVFPKGGAPTNFTEIDIHDEAYLAKKLGFAATVTGRSDNYLDHVIECFRIFNRLFEAGIKTDQVQALINDKNQKFDLLILEAGVKPILILSHIFKAPVISFSTFGMLEMFNDYTGSATHPLLFPGINHQRVNNLTLWEKTFELYKHYMFENAIKNLEKEEDKMLKKNFGPDIPPLSELKKNIVMVFLAEHHIWDNNRPVPPSVIYLGGIYPKNTTRALPKDLQTYLDSSVTGVIYVSFGTSILPSLLPQAKIQTILRVLSRLPFDVLLKWDTDKLPGISKNVKLFKWVPQTDVLRHPNIKLFITQGGLQSTDDAIAAGVPLIGIPMLGDQWYNVEQYVRLNIGLKIEIDSLAEENMLKAIDTVINDESYRHNIVSLRSVLNDQPQTALARAIWWTEYVIRHKGAPHLRAPTALISNWEYFELDLLLIIGFWSILIVVALIFLVLKMYLYWCGVKIKID